MTPKITTRQYIDNTVDPQIIRLRNIFALTRQANIIFGSMCSTASIQLNYKKINLTGKCMNNEFNFINEG